MMPNAERENSGNGLLMFVLGAASGAALALLCAPVTGRESREYVRRRAREVGEQAAAAAEKARDFVQQSSDAVVTSLEDWRSTVTDAIEDGRQVVEQGRDTVSQAIEQGKDAYQQAKSQRPA